MRKKPSLKVMDALDQAFAYFRADTQRRKQERDEAETALAQMFAYYG